MKTIQALLIAGITASVSGIALMGAANATPRNGVAATDFYDLVPGPTMQFDYQTHDGKAPHKGFDPRGNGVNPPIGAVTDQ